MSRRRQSSGAAPPSLDDPVVIQSTQQLDQMQQYLLDHLQATKSAGGQPLIRSQRAIVMDKRQEFAQSVFTKVGSKF